MVPLVMALAFVVFFLVICILEYPGEARRSYSGSHLVIEAVKRTKAKLLGVPVPSYLIGQDYEIFYRYTNLGDEKSEETNHVIKVDWDVSHSSQKGYDIPSIDAGDFYETEKRVFPVLSLSLGHIHLEYEEGDEENQPIFRKKDDKKISPNESFDFIVPNSPDGVYEKYALIIAAIALVAQLVIDLFF